MEESLCVLLLLSGLLCSASAVSRQYHYINVKKSWSEAQSYCRARFTDLATVDSMRDANGLVNTVDPGYSGPVWIGLRRVNVRHWGWSDGENTLPVFSYWQSNEPNMNECACIAYGMWYGSPCSALLFAACYSESTGYVKVEQYMSWTEAQSYCREHYTDLATIRNIGEHQQLKSVVAYNSRYWIGAFRDGWEWSDKRFWFFRHWAAGENYTTDGPECVAMSRNNSGKWFHEQCDLKHPFICYGDDDKLIKRQIVRLKLSCNGDFAMNDSLQTTVLNEITNKLKSMGLQGESEISWRKIEEEEEETK